MRLVLFFRRQFKRWGWFQTPHWALVAMVWRHHRRGWGHCTAVIVNGLWQKSMYPAWFCLPDLNSSVVRWFKTIHRAPVTTARSHHRRGWGHCTATIGNGLWQKSTCLGQFCLSYLNSSVAVWFTTLHWAPVAMVWNYHRWGWGPCYRQWFMIEINVFSLILFVRRQFKHWGSISSTTLGPSGHGKKPLS